MGTVFGTVLAGVVLLLVGRLLGILTFDPWQDQRKAIGEVDFNLLYLAYVYGSPKNADRAKDLPARVFQRINEAGDALRGCASRLDATTNAIVGYKYLSRLPRIPSYADIQKVVGHLIYLSNSLFENEPRAGGKYNRQLASEVRTLLHLTQPIEPLEGEQSEPPRPLKLC